MNIYNLDEDVCLNMDEKILDEDDALENPSEILKNIEKNLQGLELNFKSLINEYDNDILSLLSKIEQYTNITNDNVNELIKDTDTAMNEHKKLVNHCLNLNHSLDSLDDFIIELALIKKAINKFTKERLSNLLK